VEGVQEPSNPEKNKICRGRKTFLRLSRGKKKTTPEYQKKKKRGNSFSKDIRKKGTFPRSKRNDYWQRPQTYP